MGQYWCANCGEPSGMMGHSFGGGFTCKHVPVEEREEIVCDECGQEIWPFNGPNPLEAKKTQWMKRMKEQISNDDTEIAHGNADDILCDMLIELGHGDLVDLYYEVSKWYA